MDTKGSMNPEISQIVGRVCEALNWPEGPARSALIRAGEQARMPSDLPPWVQSVWKVIQGDGRGSK